MNRRQFTASLGAALAAPLVPTPVLSRVATPAALPAGSYMWADFIARARGHVDAGFLSRRLDLTPAQANAVMGELAQKGVIQPAGLSGVAQATNPFRYPTNANGGLARKLLEGAPRKTPDPIKAADLASRESNSPPEQVEDNTSTPAPDPSDAPELENPV